MVQVQIDGSRRRRSTNIGPLREYPTEAAALKAVSALRANINIETPRAQIKAISFGTFVEHYRLKEMSEGSGRPLRLARRMKAISENGFFHGGIRIVCGI